MPRALSRLRYRAPSIPVTFQTRSGQRIGGFNLEQRVAKYVAQQSNPRHVKLQIVANPKARAPSTGQRVIAPYKPFTLRDVVDPKGKARHGEIIYIFRNIKSNQIIYSLQELLKDHHLEQLPFIGKHSKPPVIRPDEWTPHCVVTFPTAEQGQNAFKKLREYRIWHEYAWDKTNPEWKRVPIKQRIKNIMDQRANTSADLAEMLRIQQKHGKQMVEDAEERQFREKDYLDKEWAAIETAATEAAEKSAAAKGTNSVDNIEWLEEQIAAIDLKLDLKHNQNEAAQKRLKSARKNHKLRLRKIQYPILKMEEFKARQQELTEKAEPANELGAEGKLDELKRQALVLRASVENPDPTRSSEELAVDKDILTTHERDIAILEDAFEAKDLAENRNHDVARSILPPTLKKPLPAPYTLEGVSVKWADLQDALYARGKWPEMIEHEDLGVNQVRTGVALLSAENYAIESHHEVSKILEALQPTREEGTDNYVPEVVPESTPAPKKGVLGRLFGGRGAAESARA